MSTSINLIPVDFSSTTLGNPDQEILSYSSIGFASLLLPNRAKYRDCWRRHSHMLPITAYRLGFKNLISLFIHSGIVVKLLSTHGVINSSMPSPPLESTLQL